MKIGFDAKRAFFNKTGLGNYSRYIINVLSKYYPQNQYFLFTPQIKEQNFKLEQRQSTDLAVVAPSRIWARFKSLWRAFGQTYSFDEVGLDIYHGLSNELPLNIKNAKCKTVLTIHDLIFLTFPKGYNAIDRLSYNFKYRQSCQNADHIIAISDFTKNEIIKHYKIPAEKISVIYQGCDPQFKTKVSEQTKDAVKAKYNLPDKYILYVGTIEERKNLLLLVKAIAQMQEKIDLVVCGRKTNYYNKVRRFISDSGIEKYIHFIHNAQFKDLPAIYQMSDVFVYPSRIEGFGIPIVEALCSGVPVIGCTGSCLEEAGGPDSVC